MFIYSFATSVTEGGERQTERIDAGCEKEAKDPRGIQGRKLKGGRNSLARFITFCKREMRFSIYLVTSAALHALSLTV